MQRLLPACLILVLILLLSTSAAAQPKLMKLENYPFQSFFQSTLSSDCFFFEREDFDRSGDEKSVQVLAGRKELPYKVWMQKAPAPLILLIPGFNDHIRSNPALALAIVLYNAGFSVAGAANAFHAEFDSAALSSPLPGYTPQDAQDVERAYHKILDEVRKDYPGLVQSVAVTGYSMGGLHALFLAKMEKDLPEADRLGAQGFLAINPPVDPIYSLKYIDEAYESFRPLDRSLRYYYFLNANERMVNLDNARNPQQQIDFIRSLDEGSLKQMLATSFRWDVHEILAAAFRDHRIDSLIQNNGPLSDLNVEYSNRYRQKLYEVLIKNYNFTRYLRDALTPTYLAAHADSDADSLTTHSGIKAIAESIKESENVEIFHNLDDQFMLTPDFISWLGETFDQHVTFFDQGGHVGNLYMKEVQDLITSTLRRMLGQAAAPTSLN